MSPWLFVPSVSADAALNGCISVTVETFDNNGAPIDSQATFTFILDGGTTVQSDATGHATFSGIAMGQHTVTQSLPDGWTQVVVTPSGGSVVARNVNECGVVVFKNMRTTSSASSSSSVSSVPQSGCIQVVKQTYDTQGSPLTPVAQFTFMLDGGVQATNDGSGTAWFSNVTPGTHTVTETVPDTWVQTAVQPSNGVVTVAAGASCAQVTFINSQSIAVSSSSSSSSSEAELPQYGCISVSKEAVDSSSHTITPVPSFTFLLDGWQQITNDANGLGTFWGVYPGFHTVTETVPGSWQQLSVNPDNGYVNVLPGYPCAKVAFKNQSAASSASSTVTNISVQNSNYNSYALPSATTPTYTAVTLNNTIVTPQTSMPPTPTSTPDFMLGKSTDKSEALPNDVVSYTIVIQSTGQSLTNVQIDDRYPADQLSVEDNGGGTGSQGQLHWSIPSLNAYDQFVVHYTARLSPKLRRGDSVVNIVTATADGTGPKSAQATVQILGAPPQTGVFGIGPDGSEYLTPIASEAGSSSSPLAPLVTVMLSAAGIGGLLLKRVYLR